MMHSQWNDELTLFHEEVAASDHFIDKASRQQALTELQRITSKQPVILEIGCSSGYFLEVLHTHMPNAQIIGADVGFAQLQRITQRFPSYSIVAI